MYRLVHASGGNALPIGRPVDCSDLLSVAAVGKEYLSVSPISLLNADCVIQVPWHSQILAIRSSRNSCALYAGMAVGKKALVFEKSERRFVISAKNALTMRPPDKRV